MNDVIPGEPKQFHSAQYAFSAGVQADTPLPVRVIENLRRLPDDEFCCSECMPLRHAPDLSLGNVPFRNYRIIGRVHQVQLVLRVCSQLLQFDFCFPQTSDGSAPHNVAIKIVAVLNLLVHWKTPSLPPESRLRFGCSSCRVFSCFANLGTTWEHSVPKTALNDNGRCRKKLEETAR